MTVTDSVAVVLVGAGLVAGLAVGLAADYRAGLGATLELWLAAALLGLVEATTWPRIATAAVVVIVRQVATWGILHPPPPQERVRSG